MTTEQRRSIPNPPEGLEVYDTDAKVKLYYNGERWLEVGGDPIGTIKAWHRDFTNTPPLPWGWKECDGTNISDTESLYDGQKIPNLNGEGRFLRGALTSGTDQISQNLTHTHTFNASGQFAISSFSVIDIHDMTHPGHTGVTPGIDIGVTHTRTDARGDSGAYTAVRLNSDGKYEARPINMSVIWIMRIK